MPPVAPPPARPQPWVDRGWRLWTRLRRWRYLKFGLVGAGGTLVNMATLYLAQEQLFTAIASARTRLNVSLALSIAVSTLNNFAWNRAWTWADRLADAHARHAALAREPWSLWPRQFGQYCLASWLGIALQYALTLTLAHWLHYLLANVTAIVVASISNFLANDRWTFK